MLLGGLLLPYFPISETYYPESYLEESFDLQSTSKVELGCILCYDTDCNSQGQCINETETYKCQCNDGTPLYALISA